jgi:hypothetical protein
MSDQDRMINQRPSDRQDNEQRGLARRQERGLSQYEGYVSPFEMMRRFSEDVDRLFGGFGFSSFPFDAGVNCGRLRGNATRLQHSGMGTEKSPLFFLTF